MDVKALWIKRTTILVVLTFLWTLKRGDSELFCVVNESCIFPCRFTSGDETLIHWIQGLEETRVHSYYHNEDQLALQSQRFKGRTSLFKDQISRGNASLQLTGVEVQDQGRYKCYTSTISGNMESFIDLSVEAPVRRVTIQLVDNGITCSSEGIYPKPGLSWSTSTQSSVTPSDPVFQMTERQLYKITSFLILSKYSDDVIYSCTVSAGRNRRKATLLKTTAIRFSKNEKTEIPCAAVNLPLKHITWRFNHSQIIFDTSQTEVTDSEWRQRVEDVSEAGSLTLQGLSSNHQGIYTCELSDDEETYVTNNLLTMEDGQGTSNVAAIGVGVAVLVLLIAVGLWKRKFILQKCKNRKKRKNQERGENKEMRTINSEKKRGEYSAVMPEQQEGVTS